MKNLNNKSQITSKNLKNEDCNYKGNRLGFDKKEKLYVVGNWNNSQEQYFDTIQELKELVS